MTKAAVVGAAADDDDGDDEVVSVMTINGHGLSEDLGLFRSGVGGNGREKRLLHLQGS